MRIIKTIFFLLVFIAGMPQATEAYGQGTYYGQGGYYSQAAYRTTISTTTTFTGSVIQSGTLGVTGSVGKGSGFFVIDHPLDPKNKLLYHSFVESPDVKNIYDGIVTLNAEGEAEIRLPEYFEALNRDFRYLVKPIGKSMPGLFIKKQVQGNIFAIGGGAPNGKVSWQITGIRHDPYIVANPIETEVTKGPDTLALRGEMLFEDHPARGFFTKRYVDYIRSLLTP